MNLSRIHTASTQLHTTNTMMPKVRICLSNHDHPRFRHNNTPSPIGSTRLRDAEQCYHISSMAVGDTALTALTTRGTMPSGPGRRVVSLQLSHHVGRLWTAVVRMAPSLASFTAHNAPTDSAAPVIRYSLSHTLLFFSGQHNVVTSSINTCAKD